MSFSGYLADLESGQSFGTTDAQQALSDSLDAQLRASNQQLVQSGTWTQAMADAANQDIAAGNQSTGANDVAGSINQGFGEGWSDGWHNITGFFGSTTKGLFSGIGDLLGSILKNIPWWFWLLAALALFFWMGGLELLRGRLKR